MVENTDDGVLLKAAPLFAITQLSEVAGCLPHSGPAKSDEETEKALVEEAKRRARD